MLHQYVSLQNSHNFQAEFLNGMKSWQNHLRFFRRKTVDASLKKDCR